MNALIGLIILVAVALVGWIIAEIKYKDFGYTVSQEEKDAAAHEKALHPQTGKEMGIHEVIKTINCKGYNAVD